MVKDEIVEITAILNSYNVEGAAPKVKRALQSMLEQDVDVVWEVLHINDGPASKDIQAVAEEFAPLFEERGVAYSFMATDRCSGYQAYPKNVAIYHAKGEYIGFLDYDNTWSVDHLRVLHDAIVEGVVWPDFTYGRRRYRHDEGFSGKTTLPGGKEIELPERESPLVKWEPANVMALLDGPLNNFVDSSDFLTSKGAFWRLQKETGAMWNEGYRRFGDWELIARAVAYAGWRGKAVDSIVQDYYWHERNLQHTRSANEVPDKEVVDASE